MNDVLRTIVRGAYDVQKLRIQMGNRICGNFKAKLGQEPGEKEETLDADATSILKDLRVRFKKLTDGIVGLPPRKDFVGDEVISEYTELCLVSQYFSLVKQEKDHFDMMGRTLDDYPIYVEWLKDVKGIGPALAGVIISEVDITKDRYASSLWKYAGLDVVASWEIDRIEPISGHLTRDIMEMIPTSRPLVGDRCCDGEDASVSDDGKVLAVVYMWEDCPGSFRAWYKLVEKGGRSKRKDHLVERDYVDKDGKPAKRMGITFNPFLKSKLIGVAGPSFLKCGRDKSPYAGIYYDYKHRLENHDKWGIARDGEKDENGHKVTSKGRRHNMAIRYAVKRFLAELYVAWRTLEKLPVSEEYSVAKLKLKHAG